MNSSCSTPAFALHVLTPTRSAPGWTRGMPPPQTRVPVTAPLRTRLTATISEPSPPTTTPSPSPSASDDDATVASYLPPDFDTASSVIPIDDLISALDANDTRAPRPRASVIDSATPSTHSVHAGERVRGQKKTKAILDAIQVPVVQSATFTFRSTRDCIQYNRGRYTSFEYGRYGNPTTRAVEEKLMALEHADDCLLSSSGMNAVTTMLLALVPENGHIVTTTDCYRRTRQFVATLLPKMGISYTVLDPADIDGLKRVFASRTVSLYFSESPTNPLMRVVDVPAIVEMCHANGAICCLDTTFATPINFRPIDMGADLVLHSGTKYISGHQDVMCGALAGRQDLIDAVRKLHGVLGGVVDPHSAYLINRGMKTLAVRMEAHNRNGEAVASFLDKHPKVAKAYYPTIESHVDHTVATRVFPKGFGGVLSFEVLGNGDPWSVETFEATGRVVDNLRIPYIGPSLGGCETLVEQVCIMGYFDQPLKERRRLGITNGLVRLSCGIEDTQDLIDDLGAALEYA